MSFWRGFLDQWNREEELALIKKEKEEAKAFEREKLSTSRQIELMKLSAAKGYNSKSGSGSKDVQQIKDAVLWARTVVPEGTPGRDEFLERISRDPSAALKLKQSHDTYVKDNKIPHMDGETLMSTFDVIVADPSSVETQQAFDDMMKSLSGADLGDSETYLDYTKKILEYTPPKGPSSTIIQRGKPVLSMTDMEKQKDIVYSQVERKASGYQTDISKNFEDNKQQIIDKGYGVDPTLTKSAFLAEWNTLVERYEKGDVQAGIIIFNTLRLNEGSFEGRHMQDLKDNPYLAGILGSISEGNNTNFYHYLEAKHQGQVEKETVGGSYPGDKGFLTRKQDREAEVTELTAQRDETWNRLQEVIKELNTLRGGSDRAYELYDERDKLSAEMDRLNRLIGK